MVEARAGARAAFELVMTTQVRDWLRALRAGDPVTRRLVAHFLDRLPDEDPALGRPLVDRITDSSLHNLKELRRGDQGVAGSNPVSLTLK